MKNTFKEHLWIFAGLLAAYIGIHVSIRLFTHHGLLYVGVSAVIIMSIIMAVMGFIVWLVLLKKDRQKSTAKIDWPTEPGIARIYKKHWIEIVAVLLVIIIFIGYLILQVTSFGQFSSEKLNSVAFPAFVFCQIFELFIILRSQFLIKNFMQSNPIINDSQALDQLKPIVSQCMIMALFFIGLLLLSMFLAAVIFINWNAMYSVITAISLAALSMVLKWYTPYEEKLKQIKSNDPLLEPELNTILQSWQNNFLPKFTT